MKLTNKGVLARNRPQLLRHRAARRRPVHCQSGQAWSTKQELPAIAYAEQPPFAMNNPPKELPELQFTDGTGQPRTLADFRGKVVLLTFLYTHCPDVCPLTALNLNTALGLVGSQAKDVAVLAVSVDPLGDTPAAVRGFIRSHHLRAQFHYLMGSAPALEPVLRTDT